MNEGGFVINTESGADARVLQITLYDNMNNFSILHSFACSWWWWWWWQRLLLWLLMVKNPWCRRWEVSQEIPSVSHRLYTQTHTNNPWAKGVFYRPRTIENYAVRLERRDFKKKHNLFSLLRLFLQDVKDSLLLITHFKSCERACRLCVR